MNQACLRLPAPVDSVDWGWAWAAAGRAYQLGFQNLDSLIVGIDQEMPMAMCIARQEFSQAANVGYLCSDYQECLDLTTKASSLDCHGMDPRYLPQWDFQNMGIGGVGMVSMV